MTDRLRPYVCFGVAVVLIIAGTITTGLLPSTTLYQVLAGSMIVAGFVVRYLYFGGIENFE